MPGEPGRAPPPTAVEVWPSVAPFGEADRISVSIIDLAFLCLQLALLSPAQAATTTRGRPQLRPQDWIRSQTPRSPPVRRSQTSAAATLRAVKQCRSSMAGSPGHQLADPDHQQWSPHNAQIRAAGAERGIRGGHRAERRLVARSPCLRLSLRVTFSGPCTPTQPWTNRRSGQLAASNRHAYRSCSTAAGHHITPVPRHHMRHDRTLPGQAGANTHASFPGRR